MSVDTELIKEILLDYAFALRTGELDGAGRYIPEAVEDEAFALTELKALQKAVEGLQGERKLLDAVAERYGSLQLKTRIGDDIYSVVREWVPEMVKFERGRSGDILVQTFRDATRQFDEARAGMILDEEDNY